MKNALQSKTLWFNAALGAVAALEGSFELLQPHMPINVFASLTVILTVGNAALRAVTSSKLQFKG